MSLLQEGQIIRETYEVEKFLGEGAFAEVYRVRHRFLGRQAMKVFKKEGMSAEEVEKTLSEAILLSRIGHPNIVRVFDANVIETDAGLRGYFTMEFVAAGTLDAYWRSCGSRLMPVAAAVDLAKQICRGLAVAHGESPPVIHRDIKPQNILVGHEENGGLRARISDFGLARRVNPLTLLASAAGTLQFKPPEVFVDAKSDSPAGDVYALGVTLYLMLSDCFPYDIAQDFSMVDPSDFDTPPRPLSDLNPDVDDDLAAIVMRCIARQASDRPSDAQALLAALEAWHATDGEEEQTRAEDADGVETIGDGLRATRSEEHHGKDAEAAEEMARNALRMAREEGLLAEAADLMEAAIRLRPALGDNYGSKIRLWRSGVSL